VRKSSTFVLIAFLTLWSSLPLQESIAPGGLKQSKEDQKLKEGISNFCRWKDDRGSDVRNAKSTEKAEILGSGYLSELKGS